MHLPPWPNECARHPTTPHPMPWMNGCTSHPPTSPTSLPPGLHSNLKCTYQDGYTWFELWMLILGFLHPILAIALATMLASSSSVMSHLSALKPEYNFWDYANCTRCHLSYTSDVSGPQVPFWLTECSHVLCNNHLSQSCLLSAASHLTSHLSIWIEAVHNVDLVIWSSYHYSARWQVAQLLECYLKLIFHLFPHRWIHPCWIGSWLFPMLWMQLLM